MKTSALTRLPDEELPGTAAPSNPIDLLPPNWVPDETLKADLPPNLDHRHFRRILEAPTFYVVNVMGQSPQVFDLKTQRPLVPMKGTRANRPRFRLNLGPTAGIKRFYLARLITQAVYGNPPKGHEAHHRDGNPQNNNWENLIWLSPKANRAIERRRKPATKPRGYRNRELGGSAVFWLVSQYDAGRKTMAQLAAELNISRMHVWRLVNEKLELKKSKTPENSTDLFPILAYRLHSTNKA